MSYSTRSISAKEQNAIITNANFAVARFAQAYANRQGMKMFFTKEDIEDIAGNTILRAYNSFNTYTTAKGALSTWVSSIAARCVITAFDYKLKRIPISYALSIENEDGEEYDLDEVCDRKRGFNQKISRLLSEFEADRNLDIKEFEDSVRMQTRKLSEKNQRFEHMLEEGYTPKDMAAVENCTPDAASKRVWVIRKTLREPVQEIADEFGIYFFMDNKKEVI